MALTRKMLKAMGIEDEKIDQIIEAHTETVEGLKQYKEDAEKLVSVQQELDDLKAKGTDDGFEKKYNDLKKEFDDYKADVEAKESNAKKSEAYRKLLKEIGVSEKRIDAVMKVADLSNVKLDKDGSIKDAGDVKKAAKEEWSDFIVTEGEKGVETETPPSGGTAKMSREEILKIKDTTARQKAIAENHELFNF